MRVPTYLYIDIEVPTYYSIIYSRLRYMLIIFVCNDVVIIIIIMAMRTLCALRMGDNRI